MLKEPVESKNVGFVVVLGIGIRGPRIRITRLGRRHCWKRITFRLFETIQQRFHEVLHGHAFINEISDAYLFRGGEHHVRVLAFDEFEVIVGNDRAERQKAIALRYQVTHTLDRGGIGIGADKLLAPFVEHGFAKCGGGVKEAAGVDDLLQ